MNLLEFLTVMVVTIAILSIFLLMIGVATVSETGNFCINEFCLKTGDYIPDDIKITKEEKTTENIIEEYEEEVEKQNNSYYDW